MLLNILKLVGFDFHAKIAAGKARIEQLIQQAPDRARRITLEAAAIAAFFAIAIATSAMVAGVASIALYRWTADAYGSYAGLGAVAMILIGMTAILVTVATLMVNALFGYPKKLPRYSAGEREISGGSDPVWRGEITSPRNSRTDTADDPGMPLTALVARIVKYPSVGNTAVDEMIGHLRASARDTAGEAIESAADIIRQGDRANLVAILAGAAFLGWLMAHHSQEKSS
jgi:hypothetical protein